MILRKITQSEAPSKRAASIISFETDIIAANIRMKL